MPANHGYDLEISRLIKAPRSIVWKIWTDPDHMKEWWCPKPWTTEIRAFDLRPGGGFHTYMSGPDGGTSDNPGCFLEVVAERRIVSTSALLAGYRPADKPWLPMTAIFSFSDEGEGTRWHARVMHVSAESRQKHEDMGFHEGWGIMAEQMDAYARALQQQG